MLLLAGIGGFAILSALVWGGFQLLGGSDETADVAVAPTTSLVLRGEPAPTVPETAAPQTTTLEATTSVPVATAAPTTIAAPRTTLAAVIPVTVASTVAPTSTVAETAPTTTLADGSTSTPVVTVPDTIAAGVPSNSDVAESAAIVRNGQIFLEGAVPNAAVGEEIEALAAEILGPDNVFNNYVIDPAAGDPNIGNITVEDTITFATSSAVVQPSAEPLLNQGLALLSIRPNMTITIVGHTDSRGSAATNLTLSQRRAESVKAWFVERGVDAERLTAVGKGDTELIADDSTAEGRLLNRRIQFFLENVLS